MPFEAGSRKSLGLLETLYAAYPQAKIALRFSNPLELLVATMLSAQCTDVMVNKVTATLFSSFQGYDDYIAAPQEELEKAIYSTGFYRNKAKSIKAACLKIRDEFGGRVPDTMAGLLKLPGVARKTANIVLANGFGKVEGIPVDTHVQRVSRRLGLTEAKQPDKIERDLMALVPRADWHRLPYTLIEHGRAVCKAKPLCPECVVAAGCPYYLSLKQAEKSAGPGSSSSSATGRSR